MLLDSMSLTETAPVANQAAPLILDGKWVRDQIFAELKPRVEKLTAAHRPPGLAVILVGNDPGSEIDGSGKGGEAALVQADLDVIVSDAIADFSRFATGGQ
jgi:hypothetical protein